MRLLRDGQPRTQRGRVGAEEAAAELGAELIWDGPTGLDAARQNEVIENWITRGVDVIAVAGLVAWRRFARTRLPREPYPGLRPFLDFEAALLFGRFRVGEIDEAVLREARMHDDVHQPLEAAGLDLRYAGHRRGIERIKRSDKR